MTKIKILLAATVIFWGTSCTKDFVSMNTNPNSATVVPATNVLGRALLSTTQQLFGERIDIYYAGTWAGYTAHIGIGDYEYRVGINNDQWKALYSVMTYATDAMRLAEEEGNENIYAAALTLRVYVAHKVSDMWGAIPYSEAFKLDENVLYPKYDTEEELYTQLLSELKTATSMFSANGGALGGGDFLFNGNIEKWQKFCNSIRLRIAIRMSSADEPAAKTELADVLNNPSQYPVITSNEDNAYFGWPGLAPDTELWYNRIGADDGNKTDPYRTNNTLISNLKSLNDPRLPVYADENKWGEYRGFKFGPNQTSDTMNNGNNVSHIGDRFGNNPAGFSPFMNAAEVYFIKSEAYQRNLVLGGNAQEAYENGIAASLEENGLSGSALSAYLAEAGVEWSGNPIVDLNKIYLQKWISLFKQSVEGWAEARRTDVPLMTDIEKNYAGSHNRPPFRMSYADEERSLNTNFPTNVQEVDIFWGTQLWWDKRSGVN